MKFVFLGKGIEGKREREGFAAGATDFWHVGGGIRTSPFLKVSVSVPTTPTQRNGLHGIVRTRFQAPWGLGRFGHRF